MAEGDCSGAHLRCWLLRCLRRRAAVRRATPGLPLPSAPAASWQTATRRAAAARQRPRSFAAGGRGAAVAAIFRGMPADGRGMQPWLPCAPKTAQAAKPVPTGASMRKQAAAGDCLPACPAAWAACPSLERPSSAEGGQANRNRGCCNKGRGSSYFKC